MPFSKQSFLNSCFSTTTAAAVTGAVGASAEKTWHLESRLEVERKEECANYVIEIKIASFLLDKSRYFPTVFYLFFFLTHEVYVSLNYPNLPLLRLKKFRYGLAQLLYFCLSCPSPPVCGIFLRCRGWNNAVQVSAWLAGLSKSAIGRLRDKRRNLDLLPLWAEPRAGLFLPLVRQFPPAAAAALHVQVIQPHSLMQPSSLWSLQGQELGPVVLPPQRLEFPLQVPHLTASQC